MKRTYLVVPVGTDSKAAEVAANMLATAEKSGKAVSTTLFCEKCIAHAKKEFAKGNAAVVMENKVLEFFEKTEGAEIAIVAGVETPENPCFARKLNESLALALDASVVLATGNAEDAELAAAELADARVRVVFTATPADASAKLAEDLAKEAPEHKISQAEFRANLLKQASANVKRIVLPEGAEPRTIQAAILAFERKIAVPVLLGKRDEIVATAAKLGLTIPAGLEIIEVNEASAQKYVPTLVELRKSKGMTEEQAKAALADNVMLGTMMLKMGEVDGLVSGAIHSTADTLRPALQVIKTAPGVKSVSSVFFMCMPDQTYVYGDCAINLNPTAEELAGIALQCDDTAKTFGLPSRVAMLSYSTINSGKGPDADLVKEATAIAKAARPEMAVDGPLQYDAATVPSVGCLKAPNSAVAGKATVFVFPSLSAGNIGYKAVQRSATNVIAVGPMLQGLAKPVNDLSRGALVEDIVYTIALTAIQAQK